MGGWRQRSDQDARESAPLHPRPPCTEPWPVSGWECSSLDCDRLGFISALFPRQCRVKLEHLQVRCGVWCGPPSWLVSVVFLFVFSVFSSSAVMSCPGPGEPPQVPQKRGRTARERREGSNQGAWGAPRSNVVFPFGLVLFPFASPRIDLLAAHHLYVQNSHGMSLVPRSHPRGLPEESLQGRACRPLSEAS